MTEHDLKVIDALEGPLRHYATERKMVFQDAVRHLMMNASDPLHAMALDYNRAMYEMQNRRR